MAPYRLSRPLDIDISSSAFKENPYPTFAAMHAAGDVIPIRLPIFGGVWMTTTHAATEAMLKDSDRFVMEGRNAGKGGAAGMPTWWMPKSIKLMTNIMLLKDEPEHRRLRKLVDQAFSRRGIADMRPQIEAIADRLLDAMAGREEVDLLADYARQLPLEVICELLGLPDQDRAAFSEWSESAVNVNNPTGLLRALGGVSKMSGYVREQIEIVRKAPREGLIGELVRAQEDGDKLDADELVAMVLLLLIAGFETTTHLIADSIVDLEACPDQKAWLLADPATRMERAVEELARHTGSVQATKPRFVARDTDFFGQILKRGEVIMAAIAAANADPAVFAEPDKLDLQRFPNPHLVFATGIHFCLGQQLARVETQCALGRLYARFPNLEITPPRTADYFDRPGMRGLHRLKARPDPGAKRRAA